jgi:hypothetical protein
MNKYMRDLAEHELLKFDIPMFTHND